MSIKNSLIKVKLFMNSLIFKHVGNTMKQLFYLKLCNPGSYYRAIHHELHDWKIVINTWNSQEFKDSILGDGNRCSATSNN